MDYDPADDDITEMMQEHRRLDLKKRRGNVDFDTLFDTFADDYFYDEGPTRSLTHWKQQDGKVLKISDMTRQHLKNAIRFLTEKYSPDTELIEVLAEELEEKETAFRKLVSGDPQFTSPEKILTVLKERQTQRFIMDLNDIRNLVHSLSGQFRLVLDQHCWVALYLHWAKTKGVPSSDLEGFATSYKTNQLLWGLETTSPDEMKERVEKVKDLILLYFILWAHEVRYTRYFSEYSRFNEESYNWSLKTNNLVLELMQRNWQSSLDEIAVKSVARYLSECLTYHAYEQSNLEGIPF